MKANNPRVFSIPRPQLFLRIKHPSLDPTDITQAIGIDPEHAAKAGPDVSTIGVRRLYSESYWLAALPISISETYGTWMTEFNETRGPRISKEDLPSLRQAGNVYDTFILAWLRKLDGQKDFFARINDEQGSVTLLIQRTNRKGSFTITPALARRIADLGVRLEID